MSPRDVLVNELRSRFAHAVDAELTADFIFAALDAAGYEVNAKGMREALEWLVKDIEGYPAWDRPIAAVVNARNVLKDPTP